MTTFFDNVCKQVVERHLLRNRAFIFYPQDVATYNDEDLQRIAGEAPENVEKQKYLRELVENLGSSLRELRG